MFCCFPQAVYSWAQGAEWCAQVADGLAFLHAQQPLIIHRDVKLDNILLHSPGAGKGIPFQAMHSPHTWTCVLRPLLLHTQHMNRLDTLTFRHIVVIASHGGCTVLCAAACGSCLFCRYDIDRASCMSAALCLYNLA